MGRLYANFVSPCVFSQCIELTVPVRILTFLFSSVDCICMLYFILLRPKTPLVWNSITSTDANQLECIQHEFAALLCLNRYFPEFVAVMLKL
jgi:hypothetical protein